MARTPEEKSLKAWVEAATGIEVVFAQQDGFKPDLPFVTLKVISDVADGIRPSTTTTDEPLGDGVKQISEQARTGTVSIQVFGPGARGYLKMIPHALRNQSVRDSVGEQIAALSHPLNGIANGTVALKTGFEERANQDWAFRYVDIVERETKPLETVNTPGTVT